MPKSASPAASASTRRGSSRKVSERSPWTTEGAQELLLLFLSHLELVERLDQILDGGGPLRLRDAHPRVRRLHVAAEIGAGSPRGVADLVGQVGLELGYAGGVQALEASVDARIRRHVRHEVVHHQLDCLATAQ